MLTAKSNRVLILVILILAGLAFRLPYMDQPIRFDEANTYERYVSQDCATILTAYDAPNNHVFHSLLAHLTTLGSDYNEWALRLPALLAGLGLVVLVFLYGQRIGGTLLGWYGGLLAAGSAHLILFSTNARGYGMVALFTVASFWCVHELLRDPSKRLWFWYALINALGCFTIPIMVYPLAASSIILFALPLLRCDRAFAVSWLRSFFITHFSIVAAVVVLYLPIILSTGADALVGNRFVSKAPWDRFVVEFPLSLRQTLDIWLPDIHPFLFIVGLAVGIPAIAWQWRRFRDLWLPLLVLAVVSLAITLVKQVIPYPRVWIFIYPFLLLVLAHGFKTLSDLGARATKWAGATIVATITVLILGSATANLAGNDPVVGSPESGTSRDVPALCKWLAANGGEGPHLIAGHYATPSVRYYNHSVGKGIVRDPNPSGPTFVLTQTEHNESLPYVLWVNGLLPLRQEVPGVASFVGAQLYRVEPDEVVGIGHLLNAQRVYFPAYFESSWYGAFSCDAQTGWILHEDHGRQHYYANDNNERPSLHWLFDEGINQWILLLPSDYPKLYLGKEKRPMVWKKGTRSPERIFIDPKDGREITEAELRSTAPATP